MVTTAPDLKVADKPARQKTNQELEVDRLMALTPADLNSEDLRVLRYLRDCRSSLLEAEAKLEEVKELRKLKVAALDDAVFKASMHFENRQLALRFA